MELIKVDAKEFGLEENKAKQISDQFKPMLDKMVELETEANEVFKLDINDPDTAKQAKQIRLKYVKVRTGTAEIHKVQKSFYLAGGKFVDGWKNAQLFASQGTESRLQDIEKHLENMESERLEKLDTERKEKLESIEAVFIPDGLGSMTEEMFDSYFKGVELGAIAKKEAEKKAEEERISKEKAELEERQRIAKENEQLKKEAEAKAKQDEKERLERVEKERLEQLRRDTIEAERLGKEAEAEMKRKEVAEKLQAEQDAKIETERKEKERIQAQLKAKEVAEQQAKDAEAKALQDELKKGDSAKVKDLINDLDSLKTKYEFKSEKNKKMYQDTIQLINKVINHIQ